MEASKKRKQRSSDISEEVREGNKLARFDQSDRDGEEGLSWKNLQLVLSLQDKNINFLKKVDLAFEYVKSSSIEEMDDTSRHSQVMSTSRTIAFLNNWVQSTLISSEKKLRLEENTTEFEVSGSFLDLRCWKIFHFCLEESKRLHVSLTCSRDFLRVIHSIVMDASSCVNKTPLLCEGTFSGEPLQLYDVALDCISLVFSSHGGVANENLDLWILLMDKVLVLILKVVTTQLDGRKLGNFVVRLSCYLFEPFAKFLRVHPTRKNSFHNFVDKLLEPLLRLLHVLHSSSCGSNVEWRINLSKLVEEILAQGLFHPTHIDGFLSLQSTVRYRNSSHATVREEKLVNKSYHRHLFDKVEKIIAEKNGLALIGLSELLHLFVNSVTRHKGVLATSSYVPNNLSQSRTVTSEKIPARHSMDAELRKSISDYFVQILEYLLEDLNKYLQSNREAVSLVNVSGTLMSIKNLLASFISNNLYLRTEDTSEGALRNFLRLIYARLMSVSDKIMHQKASSSGSGDKSQRELDISVRKDLIVGVHHLLNIEYDVIGDALESKSEVIRALESLWTMIFSSLTCCYESMDVLGQPLLFSEILSLGCKLIDLYSELRQVNSCISALCRAVRHSLSQMEEIEAYTLSASCSSYSNALSLLLSSSKFRHSLGNAIMAIPEGQASGCIKQLRKDVKESLKWIKCGHQLTGLGEIEKSNPQSCDSMQFHLRSELLGKVLSEVYIIILDSVTVTSGNSNRVGDYLKKLLDTIRPSLSSLVSPQADCIKEFSVLVKGRTLSKSTGCDNLSMCWIVVVLFRLVLFSRNLSKRMCREIGDSFTIDSGADRLKMTSSVGKGFFSWATQPSANVLDVIHSVSYICTQDSAILCSPLVYVLNEMALQRLVDLNGLVDSSEYMLRKQTQGKTKLKDDADLSSYHKRIRKWEKRVTKMRKEAAGLTEFMMGFLSSIANDQIFTPSFDGGIDDILVQGLHNNDTLNFSVGCLEKELLPYALWRKLCQNVDTWCSHAASKDLKKFLTLIIEAAIPCTNEHNCHVTTHSTSKPRHLKKVIANQIALEFLSNTTSYEQRFLSRYMASRFCKILQKSVLSIFATSGVDLSKSPAVEILPDVQIGAFPWRKPNMVPAEYFNEQINVEFAKCQCLLTLLKWMPEECLNLRSVPLYITHVLNLERLLVGILLDGCTQSCSHNPYRTFRLFVTCREVLHTLTLASSKVYMNGSQSQLTSTLPKCSLPLPWLLRSVSAVIGSQRAFPEDNAFEAKVAMFSLLDATYKVLRIISKDQFDHEIGSIISAWKLHGERKNVDPGTVEPDISECNLQCNPKDNPVALESVLQFAEALEEHLQKSLPTFRDESRDKGIEGVAGYQDLNKLSYAIACFQGLLWGLASTLGDPNAVNSYVRIKLSHDTGCVTRIKSCIDTCLNSVSCFLKALFFEDDPTLDMSTYGGNATPDLVAFLSEVQHHKFCLKKSLLMQVVRGENADAALFLHQLFIAWSAILRLNCQIDLTSTSWNLLPVVVDISQFLLVEFSRSEMPPHQLTLFCLDGVAEFLGELGSYFPLSDPSSSRDFYVKLIDLHLSVMGKCISLQGKEAKLASQEIRSRAEKLAYEGQSFVSRGTSLLGKFKERLRMSFRKYVKKSSEFHLLSAIQAVERALVGKQEGLMTNYEIVCASSSHGGEISSVVAAGIDCLDLIVETITGPRRLNMIQRHTQMLVASVINVILHLQGPTIFYRYVDSMKSSNVGPDSGSVILMCIGILERIYSHEKRERSSFQVDACHVVQSLRVPGALFQFLLQLQISETSINSTIDRMFTVDLYDACCRMLYAVLKHYKRESQQCIALVEDSVSVLLHCLEIVNSDHHVAGRQSFAWEVEEAVKCADSLRSVYEEVKQKKVFQPYSFQFLHRYIWVYCGFGPARKGFTREVDEALRPGVYALIKRCSYHDLQLLHTVFGEGPCRSTLADLQHDYKLNRYKGKV